jgi:uncharacterized membrane protein
MKSTRFWALCVVVASFSVLHGCGDDGGGGGSTEEEDVGKSTGAVCVPTLTYTADIAPLMTKYCTSCHAASVTGAARMMAPPDHNFETEAGILEAAKHIDQVAGSGPNATNTAMPPPASKGPVPTTAERATLSSWLACQAK